MFKQDLEVIDALRRDAVNIREPHPSGIKKISAYAGQLSWMGGKFPIDVSYPAPSVFDEMSTRLIYIGRSEQTLHGIQR